MFKSDRKRENGQALILICFSSTMLLGLLGLVVDVGWMYWRKEAALSAAQSAALAGIDKIASLTSITCSTTGVFCSTTPVQCPANGASDNSGTACDYANANFFNPATNTRQNVTLVAGTGTPPTASGASSTYYLTVRVSEKPPLTFLSVLADGTGGWITARATAGLFTTANGSCMYILDRTGQASLNASNDAQVSASCGITDYSSATNGLYAVGSANVTTTSGTIQYNGGYYTDNSGSRFSPTPVSGATYNNPLSSLALPWTNCLNPATGATLSTCPATTCQYTGCSGTSTTCTSSQKTWNSWQSTPYQFSPGIYCGGISISNGMGAYFAPGMYVINGGGVTLNGSTMYCVGTGACNGGGGVTFYLTGTNSNYQGFIIGNGSTANLTAPTTGDLSGILVYSDPGITAPTTSMSTCNSYVPPGYGGLPAGSSSFCGGASSTLNGIFYLPNTTMAFTNGTGSGGKISLVVKDVVFNGGSDFFSSLSGGVLQSSGGSTTTAIVE
jgi:hypothetical protein